jgi:hypothetical protein
MIKAGAANGRFRTDSEKWDAAGKTNKPTAPKARERMASGQSLTDSIVNDVMGGSRAAENQAKAYENIIGNIKAGKGTAATAGNMATAARERMIDRDNEKNRCGNEHPDKGQDKANRRAYPSGVSR